MDNVSFNRGFYDGIASASMINPVHNNWKKDRSSKVTHHNKEYLRGYKQGFKENSCGFYPFCLQ